jgi:hypothetical protein
MSNGFKNEIFISNSFVTVKLCSNFGKNSDIIFNFFKDEFFSIFSDLKNNGMQYTAFGGIYGSNIGCSG